MSANIRHRITSLERWGIRETRDFQPHAVATVGAAGFTGVLVNGGSGIGPDMLNPEAMVQSSVIPDLMPLTIQGTQRELDRRCKLVESAKLDAWLSMWGVIGADQSEGNSGESNRFFDRRTKLEIQAKLSRTPDLFGQIDPHSLSWRGNRPLCICHPIVQDFYRDIFTRITQRYASLKGILYFPGDSQPETCDDNCPRCKDTGRNRWSNHIDFVNLIYRTLTKIRPDFKFYFTVWNQDHPDGAKNISMFLGHLDPGVGICMSISDNLPEKRLTGTTIFNQPWMNQSQPGELFLDTAKKSHAQQRPIMVLGELCQSEVFDPEIHNPPLPGKTIELLRNADAISGVDAVCDFWGHRSAFISHANLAAMRRYFDKPDLSHERLLELAAKDHYGITDEAKHSALLSQALAAWRSFDDAMDGWALAAWSQRMSFAVGRDAARGWLYKALIPTYLKTLTNQWGVGLIRDVCAFDVFGNAQLVDRLTLLECAKIFEDLAASLNAVGLTTGSAIAKREAANIELAGELFASIGRTFLALDAFTKQDWKQLRSVILDEIDARERELEISGCIGFGGGVHPIFVQEDIQNMRLYLSSDLYPEANDTLFSSTFSPFTV